MMTWAGRKKRKLALFLGDVLITSIGVLIWTSIGAVDPVSGLVFMGTLLLAFYIFDLYSMNCMSDRLAGLIRLSVASGAGALLCALLANCLQLHRCGHQVLLATGLVPTLGFTWRRAWDKYKGAFARPVPTVVLGTGESAAAVRRVLESANSDYKFVGFVQDAAGHNEMVVPKTDVLGDLMAIETLVRSHNLGCVVVPHDAIPAEQACMLTKLRLRRVRIYEAPRFSMRLSEVLPVELISDSWLCFAGGIGVPEAALRSVAKRLANLALALVGLVLTLPVSVLAAIAIRLDSRGPILFRQWRVGRFERPFRLLKFRSMRVDAEPDGTATWAALNDPRATRVGRIIRRLHVDEIPQMINVLRGEMSFIGPRPERPEFVHRLKAAIPFYHLRHYILPGITGWAQVNYPYGASVEDARHKLQFDLYYMLNASALLDLRILVRTARMVLFRNGRL